MNLIAAEFAGIEMGRAQIGIADDDAPSAVSSYRVQQERSAWAGAADPVAPVECQVLELRRGGLLGPLTPHAKQSKPGWAEARPALFGTWRLGDRTAVKLQGAYLVGKTYGQPGHMFTLRAHTEF